MSKEPKISWHILQYLQKSMRSEVEFLPAYKHKNFLQVDSITLGVHSKVCPKYQNNNLTIYLQYLKGNMKDEIDILPADKCQRFLQSDTIILDVCGQPCPNYPK